jgi:hypothetical protein
MQVSGKNWRFTSGKDPLSRSSTVRQSVPGGRPFSILQAIVQVWQPTQRPRSTTIPQRVMTPHAL